MGEPDSGANRMRLEALQGANRKHRCSFSRGVLKESSLGEEFAIPHELLCLSGHAW